MCELSMLKCHGVCRFDPQLPLPNQVSHIRTLIGLLSFSCKRFRKYSSSYTHTHSQLLSDVATTLLHFIYFLILVQTLKHFRSKLFFFGVNGLRLPVSVVTTGLTSNSHFVSLLHIVWLNNFLLQNLVITGRSMDIYSKRF